MKRINLIENIFDFKLPASSLNPPPESFSTGIVALNICFLEIKEKIQK